MDLILKGWNGARIGAASGPERPRLDWKRTKKDKILVGAEDAQAVPVGIGGDDGAAEIPRGPGSANRQIGNRRSGWDDLVGRVIGQHDGEAVSVAGYDA